MLVKVKTIYLELKGEDEFRPKTGYRERLEVKEVENDAYLNFILLAGVGLPWRWYSRFKWTIRDWDEYFTSNRVKTYLGFEGKKLAGYYELEFTEKRNAEIKFFGVFPYYMGRGLGGMLLSHAVESARKNNAERVWLHTCSNDSDAALGNYLARGFRIFREEEKFENVPENSELVRLTAEFFAGYIKRYPPQQNQR